MSHERRFSLSLSVGALIIGAVLAVWIGHYGPSWPFRDSFGYLSIFNRIGARTWSLTDMLTLRNNEHFVAFHYSFALLSMWLFKLQTKILVFENGALLLFAGVIIALTLRQSSLAKKFPLLLPLIVLLPLLNPSQTSYLLWEFQIWWYLDFAIFALLIFLVERYRFRAYPFVLLLCVLATGSEAQGTFLWLSSGLHLFLMSRHSNGHKASQAKAGFLLLCVHTGIFLVTTWLLLRGAAVSAPSGASTAGLVHRLTGHAVYFLAILGGGFGVNDATVALAFGIVSIAALGFFSLSAIRQGLSSAVSRTAFLLTGMPLLWTLAFAVGREQYGLPWAFSDFHASPMLVPFYIGIAIYSIEWVEKSTSKAQRLSGAALVGFALLPVATAMPFGHERSNDMRIFSLLGSAASCHEGDFSRYLLQHLNGLDGHDDLYNATLQNRPQLCAVQPDSAQWLPLLRAPDLFEQLGRTDSQDRDALNVLWDVYLTHLDLRKAFLPSDPQLGTTLINFAAGDAKAGSPYESATLAPYAKIYLKLQK